MKGKIAVIITAMMLAIGVFALADKQNTTSAFIQKSNAYTSTSNVSKTETSQVESKSQPIQVKTNITKNSNELTQNSPKNIKSTNNTVKMVKNIVKPVVISAKAVKYENDFINVDEKIPVISGLKNTEIQKKINSTFEKDAVSFKDGIEKNAKTDIDEFKKQGIEFRKYQAYSDYSVKYNKNGYLSITVDYYMYTGGAHGGTDRRAYNYDLNTGNEIKLSSLFKKAFNYKNVINKEILNQMKKSEDPYFSGGMSDFKTIADNQPFYMADGNIVVYFGQYEIAPYAAGIPEYKIPLSIFGDNVKIKF